MSTFPLEPVEKASVDALRALQLERLLSSIGRSIGKAKRVLDKRAKA